LGTGRLGKFVCAVAKEYGANVTAIIRKDIHSKTAQEFGADRVILSTRDNPKEVIMDITHGLGADMVIETTGNPEGFSLAQTLVRPQGTISMKTTCGLLSGGFDETLLVVNEVRIQGSRCGPFPQAIDYISRHKVNLESLISGIFPLEQTAEAIEKAVHLPKILIQGMN
jgi:threonine dehydrogenase-like Zn-dependent dehydrogenase